MTIEYSKLRNEMFEKDWFTFAVFGSMFYRLTVTLIILGHKFDLNIGAL